MGIQHTARTLRASTLVEEYMILTGEPFDGVESVITDLITDLLHLAHMEGIDAGRLCRMAAIHVSAETECCMQGGV